MAPLAKKFPTAALRQAHLWLHCLPLCAPAFTGAFRHRINSDVKPTVASAEANASAFNIRLRWAYAQLPSSNIYAWSWKCCGCDVCGISSKMQSSRLAHWTNFEVWSLLAWPFVAIFHLWSWFYLGCQWRFDSILESIAQVFVFGSKEVKKVWF